MHSIRRVLSYLGAFALLASGTGLEAQTAATPTTLHRFGGGTDGANPRGMLVQGSDGNFYGTTYSGGLSGKTSRTVFELVVISGEPAGGGQSPFFTGAVPVGCGMYYLTFSTMSTSSMPTTATRGCISTTS